MGRTRDGTIALRAQVLALKGQNLSNYAIGRTIGRSEKFVRDAVKRFNELNSFESRKKSGRPSLSSPRTDRTIRRTVLKCPTATTSQLLEQVSHCFVKPPSHRTLRRILLKRLRLPARRPALKPLHSAQQRRQRVAFCNRYKSWTTTDWEQVLFSDESAFQLWRGGSLRVRRPNGQRYSRSYTLPTVKKHDSLMIWGCFSSRGRGRPLHSQRHDCECYQIYCDFTGQIDVGDDDDWDKHISTRQGPLSCGEDCYTVPDKESG